MAALLLISMPAVISQTQAESTADTADSSSENSESESGKLHSAALRLSVRSRNELGDWTSAGVEGIRVKLHSRMLYPEGRRLPDLELVSDEDGLVQAPVQIGDGHIAFDMDVVSEHYHLPTLNLPRLPESFTWPERIDIWVTPLISVGGSIELIHDSKKTMPDFEPEKTEIRCRIFNTLAVRPFRVSNSADLISHPDESGSWRAEIPANRDSASVLLFFNKVAQIEYFYIENNAGNDRYRSLDSLKEIEDWKISMTPASKISGKVLDPEGNPAEGASIMAIPTYSSQKAILSYLNLQLGMGMGMGMEKEMVGTRSQQDGSFELWMNLPTSYDVRATHSDYYVDLINITPEDQRDIVLDIPMMETISLEGVVTDDKGNHISGARVILVSANNHQPARPEAVRTRNNGRFSIRKIPVNTPLTLQIEKPEFGINQKVTLVSDWEPGTIQNIEVNRKIGFSITFEARDSVSNLPVEGLKILRGQAFRSTDNRVSFWDTFLNLLNKDGIYTYEPSPNQYARSVSKVGFALSARGYKPFVSALYEWKDAHEISVKLTPWDGLKGKVVDKNGKPIKNCPVFMTGAGNFTIQPEGIITANGIGRTENKIQTTTNEQGFFRLEPLVSRGKLIAYSKDGYAEMFINTDEYNEPVKLQLRPLIDISGSLLKSDMTAWPNQKLVFYSSQDPTDNWNFRLLATASAAQTDIKGNFHFYSMPPIDGYIQRIVNTPAAPSIRGISSDISIPGSGHINDLQMGGTGSRCSVKVLLDDSFVADTQLIVATLTEVEELPPDHIRKNPTLLELWKKSQINRKKRTRLNRYCGEADDRGLIHFENVETGRYKFVAQVFAKDADVNQNFKLRIVYESEFEIAAETGKTLHLGIVEPSDRLQIPAGANIRLIQ